MGVSGEVDGVVAPRPLDAADRVDAVAQVHLQLLFAEIFDDLQISLADFSPLAPHGRAIAELSWLAAGGMEERKSVCLGLTYALLVYDLDPSVAPGYWDYLALLRNLDDHGVATRTLLAFARRWRAIRPVCGVRLLALLGRMAEAKWPRVEHAISALMRELPPGSPWVDAATLGTVLRIAQSLCDSRISEAFVQLSFLWAARWAASLANPPPQLAEAAAVLRGKCLDLAGTLWREATSTLMGAGAPLWWAMLRCRHDNGLAECWTSVVSHESVIVNRYIPQAVLDHFLTAEQQEHLEFMLADTVAQRGERLFRWFIARHFPQSGGALPPALADCVMWALTTSVARDHSHSKHTLWERFFAVSGGGDGQVALAFAFAASVLQVAYRPAGGGHASGRQVLQALLDADSGGQRLRRLCQVCGDMPGESIAALAKNLHRGGTGPPPPKKARLREVGGGSRGAAESVASDCPSETA